MVIKCQPKYHNLCAAALRSLNLDFYLYHLQTSALESYLCNLSFGILSMLYLFIHNVYVICSCLLMSGFEEYEETEQYLFVNRCNKYKLYIDNRCKYSGRLLVSGFGELTCPFYFCIRIRHSYQYLET